MEAQYKYSFSGPAEKGICLENNFGKTESTDQLHAFCLN